LVVVGPLEVELVALGFVALAGDVASVAKRYTVACERNGDANRDQRD